MRMMVQEKAGQGRATDVALVKITREGVTPGDLSWKENISGLAEGREPWRWGRSQAPALDRLVASQLLPVPSLS